MSSIANEARVNDAGLSLIRESEGLRLEAYLCPSAVWTIGYGHTEGVRRGQVISKEKAEEFLQQDVVQFESAVREAVRVPLNPNQFSALVSLAYNIGKSALAGSTLVRKLNAGDQAGAAEEFGRWVHGPNGPLPGLIARRAAEKALFLKPVEAPVARTSWLLVCPSEDWRNAMPLDPLHLPLLEAIAHRLLLPWKKDEPAKKAYLGRRPDLTTDKPNELPLAQRVVPQKQSNSKSCGQCSAAMAITVLTGERWRDLDVAARYGYGLLQALQAECPKHVWEDAGNFTRSMWDRIETSIRDGLPVIIGLNGPDFSPSGYGHIVLIVGVEGGRVTLADPAWGQLRTVTHKQIEDCQAHTDGKFVFLCRKK